MKVNQTIKIMKVFKLISMLPIVISLTTTLVHAQDLDKILEENQPKTKEYVTATFKGTRLINLHTIESVGKRGLDFRISHRFGDLNSGTANAWGLDGPANIRLSLEYSPDGRLMIGIGRSSYQKMADGFLKYRLFRQTINNSIPISITLFSGIYNNFINEKNTKPEERRYNDYQNRLSYVHQIIFGRKFSPNFSFQVAPTFVHYNLVEKSTDQNDIFLITAATRIKFTKRQALTFEYCYRLNQYSSEKLYDSMSLGYEIETGGHVFQVHVTNSFGIADNQFLTGTQSTWENGGIRIGFNISRVFTL